MTERALSLCMREVDVTELAELIEPLWFQKVLLCFEGGEDELENALEEEERALFNGVGDSGGVSGKFCDGGQSCGSCLNWDCACGDTGEKVREGA